MSRCLVLPRTPLMLGVLPMLSSSVGSFLFSSLLSMTTLASALLSPALASVSANFEPLSAALPASANFPVAQETTSEDPLDSPYPVPWHWITSTQAQYSAQGRSGLQYYRTPSLLSPDGNYAAYSRIEVRAEPQGYESKILSVMFLENLQTGELRVIRAASPIAQYLDAVGADSEEMAGVISILMPASWSPRGDKLLARQLEGALSSSDISDYGVVWDPHNDRVQTLAAFPEDSEEMSSTLLGWNQQAPDEILFRASTLGDEENIWVSVNEQGTQQTVQSKTPSVYGQLLSRSWSGVQSIR